MTTAEVIEERHIIMQPMSILQHIAQLEASTGIDSSEIVITLTEPRKHYKVLRALGHNVTREKCWLCVREDARV